MIARQAARCGAAVIALLALLVTESAVAQTRADGRINGRVRRTTDDTPLAGVMVLLQERNIVEWSDADGRYVFTGLAPGTYTLLFTLGGYSETASVEVAREPVAVSTAVDWPLSFTETMVVQAPSRQVERASQAPASVTVIDAGDVGRESTAGQLPRLLAEAPGVQLVQSGLYDFNLNARGFNDMVNRRVRTQIDGRDSSLPHVMGYTDWSSIPFALSEIDHIEFVNGPGGALYGVGALNGLLSIVTKGPQASPGGYARLTFGELDTLRVDARHAAPLGSGWYVKALGGYQQSGDFARSRVTSVEYSPGQLPLEAVPLREGGVKIAYGSARLDKALDNGGQLQFEGGLSHTQGAVTLTSLGRFQATGANTPWVRAAFQSPSWRVQGSYTAANIKDQISLSSGGATYQQGFNFQVDAETNRTFDRGRGRAVAGASAGRQRIDSANAAGVQTVFAQPEAVGEGSVFGQVDYAIADRIRGVGALRLDVSSLYEATWSPRGAVIVEATPTQTVRFGVSQAFKAPSIAEYHLQSALAPPLDLSAIETALAPVLRGTPLGFGNVPLLAVGNENLQLEKVVSLEAGYNVLVARRTLLHATYYRNWLSSFNTGLLPQVGTSFGRLNPSYGPYRPPAALSPVASALVVGTLATVLPPQLFASMSNLGDGSPAFVLYSLANFGSARTQGLELGSTTRLPGGWRTDFTYTLFDYALDFDPREVALLPNTPRHEVTASASYASHAFDAGASVRWVGAFDWASGIYVGPVPSYTVVDLNADYPFARRMSLGVGVANLFDNRHYELFGGDLLGRRALAHLAVSW